MKTKKRKVDDVLIYKGQRYAIITADISESRPEYEVQNVESEIEHTVPVQVFLNVRAVRIEHQRYIILPRINK